METSAGGEVCGRFFTERLVYAVAYFFHTLLRLTNLLDHLQYGGNGSLRLVYLDRVAAVFCK